ncbi:MAG TPA: class I SAM-dependent methyltransferase [Melioribacteraceae bacterium]|nr:class I SAM-dependent methyltransferase [Melioribacteraceae bacterium]
MKKNPFDIYTEEYEDWFSENETIFQSELIALKQVVPVGRNGLEIGIGSGIFAERLGIKFGIDPSDRMLEYARKRNLNVEKGFAESLPYPDSSFDIALFITSICFINNPDKALTEAYRILKSCGELIIAFIDRDSLFGKSMEEQIEVSKFYRSANFYSADEIIKLIESNGFKINRIIQTLLSENRNEVENPVEGTGKEDL